MTKKITDANSSTNSTQSKKLTIDGEVLGEEEITFKNRTVKAIKVLTITSEEESDASITYTKDTAWYVPEVKRSVLTKSEVTDTLGFSATTTTKVLNYHLSK